MILRAAGAPPHTRGSTLGVDRLLAPYKGSPAHAGIDLRFLIRINNLGRLPRTRGDRPPAPPPPAAGLRAPPHTRGSTHCSTTWGHPLAGSPAHAGIDLVCGAEPYRLVWLPRTRGDRPICVPDRPKISTAPPHTRGSTPPFSRPLARRPGSPAHAGIDPAEKL